MRLESISWRHEIDNCLRYKDEIAEQGLEGVEAAFEGLDFVFLYGYGPVEGIYLAVALAYERLAEGDLLPDKVERGKRVAAFRRVGLQLIVDDIYLLLELGLAVFLALCVLGKKRQPGGKGRQEQKQYDILKFPRPVKIALY